LIEKIKELRANDSQLPGNLFDDFIERIKTLTPTELKIFRYYAEGKNISEIKYMMYISTSTIKTHNKHIYTKLGISSRNELTLYVELLKKSGMTDILNFMVIVHYVAADLPTCYCFIKKYDIISLKGALAG